jgi:hypothetical protein
LLTHHPEIDECPLCWLSPLLAACLVAAGKPKMQAIGACMRKLVMVCYGVLKNRAPFDSQLASRIAP